MMYFMRKSKRGLREGQTRKQKRTVSLDKLCSFCRVIVHMARRDPYQLAEPSFCSKLAIFRRPAIPNSHTTHNSHLPTFPSAPNIYNFILVSYARVRDVVPGVPCSYQTRVLSDNFHHASHLQPCRLVGV